MGWRGGGGGFNEDSCSDGSSRLLCGPVNTPGRQMG